MSIKTYSVTLTDLGTYTVVVAAFDEKQACDIAKTVLHQHAFVPVPGLAIDGREAHAVAVVSSPQPERCYRVEFLQRILHDMLLPANDHAEAVRHADWLIDNAGPLEFDMIDERVGGIVAEVVS